MLDVGIGVETAPVSGVDVGGPDDGVGAAAVPPGVSVTSGCAVGGGLPDGDDVAVAPGPLGVDGSPVAVATGVVSCVDTGVASGGGEPPPGSGVAVIGAEAAVALAAARAVPVADAAVAVGPLFVGVAVPGRSAVALAVASAVPGGTVLGVTVPDAGLVAPGVVAVLEPAVGTALVAAGDPSSVGSADGGVGDVVELGAGATGVPGVCDVA